MKINYFDFIEYTTRILSLYDSREAIQTLLGKAYDLLCIVYDQIVLPLDNIDIPDIIQIGFNLESFILSVNSSGFSGYLEQSAGDNFEDVVTHLLYIKAHNTHSVLIKIPTFFPGGIFPNDADERFKIIMENDELSEKLDIIDKDLYLANDDLFELYRDYLVQNIEYFYMVIQKFIRKNNFIINNGGITTETAIMEAVNKISINNEHRHKINSKLKKLLSNDEKKLAIELFKKEYPEIERDLLLDPQLKSTRIPFENWLLAIYFIEEEIKEGRSDFWRIFRPYFGKKSKINAKDIYGE